MSEPTIDEMLAWVSLQQEGWIRYCRDNPDPGDPINPHAHAKAIRAILEQHEAVRTKLMLLETAANFQERKAIRAFVERVESRDVVQVGVKDKWEAALDELAKMEGKRE